MDVSSHLMGHVPVKYYSRIKESGCATSTINEGWVDIYFPCLLVTMISCDACVVIFAVSQLFGG